MSLPVEVSGLTIAAPDDAMTYMEAAVVAETSPGSVRLGAKPWPVIVMAALVLLLYRAVLIKLCHDWWNDPDFSHGFIVPLFSLFLVYRDRARWAAIPPQPTWTGLFLVAMALAQLLAGVMGAELFVAAEHQPPTRHQPAMRHPPPTTRDRR